MLNTTQLGIELINKSSDEAFKILGNVYLPSFLIVFISLFLLIFVFGLIFVRKNFSNFIAIFIFPLIFTLILFLFIFIIPIIPKLTGHLIR